MSCGEVSKSRNDKGQKSPKAEVIYTHLKKKCTTHSFSMFFLNVQCESRYMFNIYILYIDILSVCLGV